MRRQPSHGAGVVDENVDGAVRRERLIDEVLDIRLAANVAADRRTARRRGYCIDLFLAPGRRHDFGSGVCVSERDGFADASSSAGDNGHFVA